MNVVSVWRFFCLTIQRSVLALEPHGRLPVNRYTKMAFVERDWPRLNTDACRLIVKRGCRALRRLGQRVGAGSGDQDFLNGGRGSALLSSKPGVFRGSERSYR